MSPSLYSDISGLAGQAHQPIGFVLLARKQSSNEHNEKHMNLCPPKNPSPSLMEQWERLSIISILSQPDARRDIAMRKIIESEIDRARTAAADECERQAQSLATSGKAAPQKWP